MQSLASRDRSHTWLQAIEFGVYAFTGAPRPPQMAPGQPNGAPAVMGYPRQPAPQQLPPPQALGPLVQHGQMPPRREATNEYAALFVALIGTPWHSQTLMHGLHSVVTEL